MTLRGLAFAAALLLAPVGAGAQTAADHLVLGDKEHAAMNAPVALEHYRAAVKADSTSYEANWKASREAVDVGEFEADKDRQRQLYRDAESYARAAVKANPEDAEGHFALARALGRAAQSMGSRDRVRYAGEVREHALEALRLNPKHAGALHVLGMWNAEVMRLSGMERFFAKNVLGGRTFSAANWNDAVQNLEQAVALEPDRLTHRLDLGRVYADVENKAKAREQLEYVTRAPASEYNDANYKRQAEEALQRIR